MLQQIPDKLYPVFCYNKKMDDKKFYVYILLTEQNTLYCGYTDNLTKRFELHKAGKGAKYTRSHKPVKIVYSKEYETKQEAQKEEYRIKKLTKIKKLELINSQINVTKS